MDINDDYGLQSTDHCNFLAKNIKANANESNELFDEMCKKYSVMQKHLPKTMDALHYEIDESGKLTLYIIEFKNFSIDGEESTYKDLEVLKKKIWKKKNKRTVDFYSNEKLISDKFLKKFNFIKNHFVDRIEFDLKVKPMETILVALPWLYDEYCKDNGIVKKDFRKYLNDIDIRLVVFVNRYAPKRNISAAKMSAHAIDNALKEQYTRLELSNVIKQDNNRIMAEFQFPTFIKKEKLTEK